MGESMGEHLAVSFFDFDGSAESLSQALFKEDPACILGSSPLTCAIPQAGAVADVSLPTFAGVNPSRIKARAYIERMDRALNDPATHLFAVWGAPQNAALERLCAADERDLLAAQTSFFETMCVQNDNASTIAHYLACHPFVAQVRYPGLKSDESFDAAAQALAHGFGNAVDYMLEDDARWERLLVGEQDVIDQIERLEALLAS